MENKDRLIFSKLACVKFLLKIFFLLCLFLPAYALPQEKKPDGSTTEEKGKKRDVETARMKRKRAKKEWKEKRKEERKEIKAVRAHHKKLQTKETRKRMKKNNRKANRINQNKKQFFLIRLFKPKPKTGPW